MYTELKTYQIIIALMKKWGIRHCVLSAGSRNVPFVHSVEEDPYFKCYSVVDERSAGYFALGLAQELNEPVVISCTSSTATCNYWPPVAEAWYRQRRYRSEDQGAYNYYGILEIKRQKSCHARTMGRPDD